MPRNASGTYTLPSGNPVVSGTLIEANWANTTLNDIANELTDSLSRSGEGGMLAPFRLADGLQASPGIAWLNEPSTGFYREGSGEMWGVVGGTQVLQYTAAGVLVPNGRTFTANGGISATTLSTSGAATLASASVTGNLSVGGTLTLTGGLTLNGNVTVGDAATDTLTINSTITSNLIFTDNTYDIGASGATRPRHLYLAGNGVIGGTLGVSGVLTASGGVTGNLTGNVTGNVTGNISGGTVAGTTGIFSSNVTVGGTLGVTGAATLSNTLAVTGAITATGGVLGNVTGDLTGNVTGNISGGTVAGSTGAFSSNVTVGGTLGVTGGSTLNGGVVINELGADADTRIEGDTDPNLFFVDASTDRIGVGTNAPAAKFDVAGIIRNNGSNVNLIKSGTTGNTAINFGDTSSGDVGQIYYDHDSNFLRFGVNDAERLRIDSSGNLGLGVTPSAWNSVFKAIDFSTTASLAGSSGGANLFNNAYWNGSDYIYKTTAGAARYLQSGNEHYWYTAPSGTAGNTITFGDAKMTLTAAGALGIGTTSPSGELHVKAGSGFAEVYVQGASSTSGMYLFDNNTEAGMWKVDSGYLAFGTNNTERARIDSSGNLLFGQDAIVGQNTTDGTDNRATYLCGGANQTVGRGSNVRVYGNEYSGNEGDLQLFSGNVANSEISFNAYTSSSIITFLTNNTERMRLDASGNLGVANTSPGSYDPDFRNLVVGTSGSTGISIISGTSSNGTLAFGDGTGAASYRGYVQYNHTSDYLVLGTAAAERARITSGGNFCVGTTSDAPGFFDVAGITLGGVGYVSVTRDGDISAEFNRKTNDGSIVSFRQGGIEEGTISVSGNTVSYNAFAGSHWSQLQDGSKPDILRGTVMESINELCVWPGEENERLPKAKISDTAGSKKVYGVFMAWDNDWTETNDMYVTAVGAFICRVNGSVTVQEGDLLESNGDGTARVQADDIIRSSTIGKVTSTVKTHQYDDGSYCVPTVLYCG